MLNKLKKYPSYKDSEIDWLEKIPSHWELIRLGSEFEERREKVSDKDFEALSVTKNGIVPQLENAAKSNDGDNRKGVRKGDFVINSRSDRKGSSGIAYQDGSVSLINIVLKPKSIFPKYSEYLLKSYHFIEEYYRYGHGIVADLWTTRYSEMKAMPIPLPPLQEQTAIANFLDKKTAEIKEFIALKEKTIELLKERKMAIINQAVTKGLDSTVEMKNSGIEWLGEIPKHWEVKKLKYFVNKVGSGVTPSGGANVYVDKGIPLLRSQNVHFDKIDLSEVAYIKNETHKQMSGSKVYSNDLLLNITGGSIGRCFYVSEELGEANVNQHVCIIRPKTKLVQTKYLYYLMYSKIGQTQVWLNQYGGGREGLNFQNIKAFQFPIPDLQNQITIIQKLDETENQFKELIDQTKKEIELIKEYQQSLISEVVTGKVDVSSISEK